MQAPYSGQPGLTNWAGLPVLFIHIINFLITFPCLPPRGIITREVIQVGQPAISSCLLSSTAAPLKGHGVPLDSVGIWSCPLRWMQVNHCSLDTHLGGGDKRWRSTLVLWEKQCSCTGDVQSRCCGKGEQMVRSGSSQCSLSWRACTFLVCSEHDSFGKPSI